MTDTDDASNGPRLDTERADQVARWIQAARERQSEPLGELAALCRGYLLAVANEELDETLRGKIAASDVVQETLLRMQTGISGFRGSSEDELLGWLKRILKHYLADARRAYYQSEKREIQREVTTQNDDQDRGADWRAAIDSATPGRALAAAEELDRLRMALGLLSPEHREVLKLRTWERRSFAEVGRHMNRTADAARMLWTRAVQQLSQTLRRLDDAESP